MVVVKVGLGPLRRPEMDKDRPNTFRLNGMPDPGDVVQSLAAERAPKMAKKNEQQRGFIQELEQSAAALGAVLLEHGGHLRLLRVRPLRIR